MHINIVGRGSRINGRLVNNHPERITAVAFLAAGYSPPSPATDIQTLLTVTKEAFGYELFGYWLFFAEEGADKIIDSHVSPV